MAEPSAITQQPQNTSLLQTTKYVFVMPRINNLTYFCQEANLPGMTLPAVARSTPIVDLHSPGNKLEYNPLSLTFIIDSELKSWTDIHDWMRDLTLLNGKNYTNIYERKQQQSQKQQVQYADGILTVLSGLNNPKFRIHYANLFPISLTDIDFKSTGSADDILTATVSFRYDFYDIEILN